MTLTSATSSGVALGCSEAPAPTVDVELLIVPVRPGSDLPHWLSDYSGALDHLFDLGAILIHRTPRDDFRASVVALVAVESDTPAAWREAGRTVSDDLRTFSRVALNQPADTAVAVAFVRGFCEARYRFHRYRSTDAAAPCELTLVDIPQADVAALATKLRAVSVVEEAVMYCRDLTNTPARDLTPEHFAAAALALTPDLTLEVQVRDEQWLASERFGGLVSVGAGSPNPPRLVEVSYRGEGAPARPVVLVGKGVTFDSGGLSLKKSEQMVEMKSDMAGAAVVLAVMRALGELRPAGVHVMGLMALAENLPGPRSLRPGDIIAHRNGLTTEVVNTDCEGRLILSDTLAYGSDLNPAAMIDLATLTYSTIAALGMEVTAALGTDRDLIARLATAGVHTGDPYWELPLWEPYRKHIESPFADLRNEETEDSAGAIAAALYLREFVGEIPWVHLDIGGTAYLDEETDHLAAGATGWGVRSLYHFITDVPATRQGDLA